MILNKIRNTIPVEVWMSRMEALFIPKCYFSGDKMPTSKQNWVLQPMNRNITREIHLTWNVLFLAVTLFSFSLVEADTRNLNKNNLADMSQALFFPKLESSSVQSNCTHLWSWMCLWPPTAASYVKSNKDSRMSVNQRHERSIRILWNVHTHTSHNLTPIILPALFFIYVHELFLQSFKIHMLTWLRNKNTPPTHTLS